MPTSQQVLPAKKLVLRPRDLWNLAGVLTMMRLPLAIAFPFIAHRVDLALGVFLLAQVSDAVDGPVARYTKTTSPVGAFADGWLDKIFNIQVAWALVNIDVVESWWLLCWFSREIVQFILVPWYVRRYVRGDTPPNQPSSSGRLTSILLTAAVLACLLRQQWLALPLTPLIGTVGLWTAVGYIRREFEHLRESR